MTIDDRLRRALAEFRDDQSLDPDALGEIRQRGDAPTRRDGGPLVALAGAALVVLLALLVVLVGQWAGENSQGVRPTSSRGATQTVAAFGDGSIRVLDERGKLTRLIVNDIKPPATGFTTVAVSPDGRTVYFDRRAAREQPGCAPSEVVRVSIKGGVPKKVADGTHPAISPNGRSLAFGSACLSQIIVWDLNGGGSSVAGGAFAATGDRAEPVAWSPDNRTLLTRVYRASGIVSTYLIAVTEGGTGLEVPIGEGYPTALRQATGFFGSTDRLVATFRASVGPQIVVIDAATARIDRTLFNIAGSLDDASILISGSRDRAQVFERAPPDTAGTYLWTKNERRARKVATYRQRPVISATLATKPQSTPSCSTILAAGRTTPDLVHPPRCLGPDGKAQGIGGSSWACKNRNPVFGNEYGDRRLFANEYGYGVGGEPWHTDAKDGDYDPASPLGRAIAVCEGRATP